MAAAQLCESEQDQEKDADSQQHVSPNAHGSMVYARELVFRSQAPALKERHSGALETTRSDARRRPARHYNPPSRSADLIESSARIPSIARRAVLAIVVAIAIGHVPANAGLFFEQLNVMETNRIANENARYQAVMKELEYERTMADQKLADQLKICTTAKCKAAQRADHVRTQSQLDVEEEQANAAHVKKIAQIKAAFTAEKKSAAPP
jgi:hypothetical protein